MRSLAIASALVVLGLAAGAHPATAAKSKMGCEIGKEIWDASAGKCVPGTPKTSKKAPKATAKKADKK
jgi:hypothetical protein